MCGIAGFVSTTPDVHAARRLEQMAAVLVHRGPDGQGFYLQHDPAWNLHRQGDLSARALEPGWSCRGVPESGVVAGLANTRLAIVDLAHGQQPVWNEDRTVVAVFNGEIYNYQSLREELLVAGHRLASRSDTEILPHLYEQHGLDGMLERLDGMFALALWDVPRATLVLARDRLGEKPLYYRTTPHGILFASELKGLLVREDVPRVIDPVSVVRYLVLEAVPAPSTIYQGIRQLEPASFLIWRKDGGTRTGRYWAFPTPEAIQAMRRRRSDRAWLEALEGLLEATVRSRLTGDVPIAVLLSGGLDSSMIAAIVSAESESLHSFSVGFREQTFDESEAAHDVAARLGTHHHHLLVGIADVGPLLARIQLALDEPLADGSLVPTWALMAWVHRNGLRVALSGDGGDEVFGGYPTYQAHRLDPLWDRVPPSAARVLLRAARLLPTSYEILAPDFLVRRTLAGVARRGPLGHAVWMGGLEPEEALGLRKPELQALLPDEARQGAWWTAVARDPLEEGYAWPEHAQLQDLQHYLPNDLLVKVDRAAMASSLEVRAPMLAHELVAFGLALPPRLKVTLTETKVALRRLCAGRLPAWIARRPKKGFGMPTARWLRTLDRPVVEDWLAPPPGAVPFFDARQVRRWLDEHRAGVADHRKRLWPIVMFERWRRGPWGPGG